MTIDNNTREHGSDKRWDVDAVNISSIPEDYVDYMHVPKECEVVFQ